jgi:hypothetical protein
MLMVTFRVDGTPVPKGRPRFARMGKLVAQRIKELKCLS